jgi:peptide chain release factor subunit 1
MAGTVSWERLRELAEFEARDGRAISLYLDLDPSTTPTAGDIHSRVNSLVDELRGKADGRGLSHSQREGLRSDVERIRKYLEQELDRDGVRGVALFCAGLDNFWRPLPLAHPVAEEVHVSREFYLAPLVPLIGRGEGAIVAVVSREQGRFYRFAGGGLRELADHSTEMPFGHHDQGGWSQARYQRHVEKLGEDHFRHVAEELDRHVRQMHGPRVVIVCSDDVRPKISALLPHDVAGAIVGWTTAEAHANAAELLEVVRPVLEDALQKEERDAVERWREEAGRNGRAVAGWEQTLEAASDGRVEILLYQDGAERPAWRCPQCGRASAEGGSCPLDGTRMEEAENGLDLAVHQTLGHGGRAWALTRVQDLEPVEGIGALLRY